MSKKGMSFEEALQELRVVVSQMEAGQLPLDELITRYEKGMQLVALCRVKLQEAEQRIEVLTKRESPSEES